MVEPNLTQNAKEIIETEIQGISKERREILRSIHEAVFDRNQNEIGRITTVISRFATLLVSVSEQTDSIQKKVIFLTWVITILTTVLVFLTLVLLFK